MQTQSFAKLKVIEVTSCDGLKNLFLYSLTGNLSQLHEIEISSCEGMTEIIAVENKRIRKNFNRLFSLNCIVSLYEIYLSFRVSIVL